MSQHPAPQLPQEAGTSVLAITSLILGIASFLCVFLAGVPAIISGILALSKISGSHGRVGGKGLAIAGIVTGALGCLWTLVLIGMLMPAIQATRTAARRVTTQNNIRQLVLCCHNHESAFMRFPSNIGPKHRDAGELLSWRVHLLPFLEQNNLYEQFHLDEPWDSPHNLTLITLMPEYYQHPQLPELTEQGLTVFQMPTSSLEDPNKTILVSGQQGSDFSQISDGSTNTIMIFETSAAAAVPWTAPQDWKLDPSNPQRDLGDAFPGGFNVGLCDCSTHFINPQSAGDKTLNALFMRDDGQIVELP